MNHEQASGKMRMGFEILLSKYPFIGGVLASCRLGPADEGTMGVGFVDGKFQLHYNPDFVHSLTLEQLVGALHHECRHLVHRHCEMTPEEYPNREALALAQELCVNEDLPEPLPPGAVFLKDFPAVKTDQDVRQRYRILARRPTPPHPQRQGRQDNNRSTRTPLPMTDNQVHSGASARTGVVHTNEAPKGRTSGSSTAAAGLPKPWDDHSRWDQIRRQDIACETLLRNAACEALAHPGKLAPVERELLKGLFPQWGLDPGNALENLGGAKSAVKLDWRVLLRRYLGEELGPALSYRRPPRRFPEWLGIVPAHATTPIKPRILCALDTSGSMDSTTLAEIADELDRLRRDYDVMLIECDTRVQRARKLRARIGNVAGRGGTDLTVPFQKVILHRYRPDLILVCTDGLGPAPERAPRMPTIWLLTADGERPTNWGRVLRLARKGDR